MSGSIWRDGERAIQEVMDAIYNKDGWWDERSEPDGEDVLSDFVDLVVSGNAPNDLYRAVRKAYSFTKDDPYGRYDTVVEFFDDYLIEVGGRKYIDVSFDFYEDDLLKALESKCVDGASDAIDAFMSADQKEKNAALKWFERNAGRNPRQAAKAVLDAMMKAAVDEARDFFDAYVDDSDVSPIPADDSGVVGFSRNSSEWYDAFESAVEATLHDHEFDVDADIAEDVDVDLKEIVEDAINYVDLGEFVPRSAKRSDVIESGRDAGDEVGAKIIEQFEDLIDGASTPGEALGYKEVFDENYRKLVDIAFDLVPGTNSLIELFAENE